MAGLEVLGFFAAGFALLDLVCSSGREPKAFWISRAALLAGGVAALILPGVL